MGMLMAVLALQPRADGGMSAFLPVVVGGGLLVMFLIFTLLMSKRYRKVSPNEALIITGRKSGFGHFSIVTGGATFVIPILEEAKSISLEQMRIEIKVADGDASRNAPVSRNPRGFVELALVRKKNVTRRFTTAAIRGNEEIEESVAVDVVKQEIFRIALYFDLVAR